MSWADWTLIIAIILILSIALLTETFRNNLPAMRQEIRGWVDFYTLTRKRKR